jgi:hypothetical protein
MNLATLDRIRGTLIAEVGGVTLRVVYSDEGESSPLVVITALIMNMDEHWSNVESNLRKIKSETPKSLLHEGEEFKGSLLYQAIRKRDYLLSVGSPIDPDLTKAAMFYARFFGQPSNIRRRFIMVPSIKSATANTHVYPAMAQGEKHQLPI